MPPAKIEDRHDELLMQRWILGGSLALSNRSPEASLKHTR
jgi:hypothetical protein